MIFEDAKKLFEKYGLNLDEEKYKKFCKYEEMLVETNKVMNLTAITETNDVWIKHFLDSVLIVEKVGFTKNASVIDVGCGAGFPSIPLAIYRDDLKITMLDSLNKRVGFLKDVISELSLDKCKAVHSRAEDAGKNKEYREKYDYAVARAVANMNTLSEYCIPFVKEDGLFVAMKGPNEDINSASDAIVTLGGDFDDKIEYDIEGNRRVVYTIYKVSPTPSKYPRNSKQMKNNPL